MKRIIIGIPLLALVTLPLVGCGNASAPELSESEIAAVQDYTDAVISKLDGLYAKFEEGEAQAKRISDEMEAPYQMAIGSMAEVRKVADEVQDLNVPPGAETISDTVLTKLRSWQDGLDEIAQKEASEVSLNDPVQFYGAYLDVLIEIPELKAELR